MCDRETQGFGYDLARSRCAEELTTAAWRCARATAQFRRLFECEQSVRESRAERLYFASIFTLRRQQCDAAGNDDARQRRLRRERHHHRGQALVARGDAEHAAPRRQ